MQNTQCSSLVKRIFTKVRISIIGSYYLYLSILFGGLCIGLFFGSKEYYPYAKHAVSKSHIKYKKVFYEVSNPKSEKLLIFLKNDRKEHYSGTLKTLGSSIDRLALLVLIAILLLYFRPSEIQLFGVKIPNLAVYIVLPVCILYYWLVFGFSLFSAIDSRESLFHLTSEIETTYKQEKKITYYEDLALNSRFSLEDLSIVDAWSNVFLGYYERYYQFKYDYREVSRVKFNQNDIPVILSLLVIFGGLQGIAMGCTLLLIQYYRRNFSGGNRLIVGLAEGFIFIFFLLSFYAFYRKMHYSTLYLASLWFWSGAFFFISRLIMHTQIRNKIMVK
ncbi:MAG: hypothetical protein ACOYNC_13975 [Bacteroidales bacterium]